MKPPEVRALTMTITTFLFGLDIRSEALAQSFRTLARNAGTSREEISSSVAQQHLAHTQVLFKQGLALIDETQLRLAGEPRS